MAEPHYTYQGVTLLNVKAQRMPGTSPDSCEIELPAADFGTLKWEKVVRLFGNTGFLSSVQGGGKLGPTLVKLQGSSMIRGDLVLDDGRGHSVTFADMYVSDDGYEVVSDGDDEDGDAIVKARLVDIRYFWSRRGELWGSFNVTNFDGFFDPASGRPDGSRWSLREIIAKILEHLPGRPPIDKAPDLLKTISPPNVIWRGSNPREELDRLLKTYGLTFALTLGNRAVLTDESEPYPEDASAGARRTIGGATLPAGEWKRRRRHAFKFKPESVRIVGPAVVREVRIDRLQPVGFALDPETLTVDERTYLPAHEAAQTWRFALMADLGKYVLRPDKDRGEILKKLGINPATGQALLDRWAFRMFRLPPDALPMLPILEERAESLQKRASAEEASKSSTGTRSDLSKGDDAALKIPPLVEVALWEEVRISPKPLPPEPEQTGTGTDTPAPDSTPFGTGVITQPGATIQIHPTLPATPIGPINIGNTTAGIQHP